MTAGETVTTPDGIGVVVVDFGGRCDWVGCSNEHCVAVATERWPGTTRNFDVVRLTP